MRYELSDREWSTIRVMLPNKPRGVARVDDRRVLNGILGIAVGRALARSSRRLRPPHHLLQSVRALATGRNLDGHNERAGSRT